MGKYLPCAALKAFKIVLGHKVSEASEGKSYDIVSGINFVTKFFATRGPISVAQLTGSGTRSAYWIRCYTMLLRLVDAVLTAVGVGSTGP